MFSRFFRAFGSSAKTKSAQPVAATVKVPSTTAPRQLSSSPQRMADGTLEYASSCVIPTEFIPLPLIKVTRVSHNSAVFEFGLKEGQSLDLPVCACILAKAPHFDDPEADPVVRPYTPITSNKVLGKFALLVKRYDQGQMSRHLHDKMKVGDSLEFKHISFNIKVQYPFQKKSLTMIGGGTGITPLYQALQKIMENPEDKTEVTLLLGNNTPDDILMRKELDEAVAQSEGRVKVVHVISNSKDWEGETGYINLELISRYAPPPSDDTLVMVCGPPPMYASICGPRDEKTVEEGTALQALGYNETNVFKF